MSATFDPSANVKHGGAINPGTVASETTTNGAAVDTRGWRWAICRVQIGVVAGTTTGVSAVVAASDTASGTFVAITGATFPAATLLAGATQLVGRIDLHKLTPIDQRTIRIQVTTAGGSPSVPMAASIELLAPSDSDLQTTTYSFAV